MQVRDGAYSLSLHIAVLNSTRNLLRPEKTRVIISQTIVIISMRSMAASLSLSEKERLHSAVSGYTARSFKGSSVCVGEGIIAVCHVASLA